MFSKLTLLFVLANAFYAYCRPQAHGNGISLSESTTKALLNDPNVIAYVKNFLAQLASHINYGNIDAIARAQARNAKYGFSYAIDDNINGKYEDRQERRDGGKTIGSYAYDDGNIIRSVHYEADENGFRVIKDETGPSQKARSNFNGEVHVKTSTNGHTTEYAYTLADLQRYGKSIQNNNNQNVVSQAAQNLQQNSINQVIQDYLRQKTSQNLFQQNSVDQTSTNQATQTNVNLSYDGQASNNIAQQNSASQVTQNNLSQKVGSQTSQNIIGELANNLALNSFNQNTASEISQVSNTQATQGNIESETLAEVSENSQNIASQTSQATVQQNLNDQAQNSFTQNGADHISQNANLQTSNSQVTKGIINLNNVGQTPQHLIQQNSANQVTQNRLSQNVVSQISQATIQQNLNNQVQSSLNPSSLPTGDIKQVANGHALPTQADNAEYQFATQVDDNISGNFQQRQETRNGKKVTGSYSYDDGYILRTVVYEADDKGFRIVKEKTQPSVKASQPLTGKAEVRRYLNGHKEEYEIIAKKNN